MCSCLFYFVLDTVSNCRSRFDWETRARWRMATTLRDRGNAISDLNLLVCNKYENMIKCLHFGTVLLTAGEDWFSWNFCQTAAKVLWHDLCRWQISVYYLWTLLGVAVEWLFIYRSVTLSLLFTGKWHIFSCGSWRPSFSRIDPDPSCHQKIHCTVKLTKLCLCFWGRVCLCVLRNSYSFVRRLNGLFLQ